MLVNHLLPHPRFQNFLWIHWLFFPILRILILYHRCRSCWHGPFFDIRVYTLLPEECLMLLNSETCEIAFLANDIKIICENVFWKIFLRRYGFWNHDISGKLRFLGPFCAFDFICGLWSRNSDILFGWIFSWLIQWILLQFRNSFKPLDLVQGLLDIVQGNLLLLLLFDHFNFLLFWVLQKLIVIHYVFQFFLGRKKADAWADHDGAHAASEAAHHGDNADPTIVNVAEVLQPPVIPNPREAQGKDESARQEREENVEVDSYPFRYGPRGDYRHFDAESKKVDEFAYVVRIIFLPSEFPLAQQTAACFNA